MDNETLALAQTMDDGSGKPTLTDSAGAITLQHSVLPQVQLVDGAPQFVSADKPRFILEEQLGAGGVGEVVRARDEDIGRSVAIKRLRSRDRSSLTSVARFVDEMRVTGCLDHPNVVPVHDVGVNAEGDYFFVMRHVRGETLESIIERLAADDPETHRHFGVERRVEIFKNILDAVAYAHSRGIVHRDLKPANVMVGPFGEVVVMDWGIAKPIARPDDFAVLGEASPVSNDEGLERAFSTQIGALVGTPAYMAPEQVVGEAVDERTDIYALCVLFHEMLFLEHYLDGKDKLIDLCNAVVHETLPHRTSTKSELQPTVPPELYWIAEMGTRKEPERRFQSVAEIIDRLERRAQGDIVVQCHLTATRSAIYGLLKMFDSRPTAFILVTASAIAALVGLIVWAVFG